MKSIKILPEKGHSKTNGHETRANTALKGKDVFTEDHSKQKEKKNTRGKGNTPMRTHMEMTIHEIRNPLTAIGLANQAIQEHIQSDQLHDSIFACTAIINKNIATIETMLKDLLTAGSRDRMETMPVDVCFLIENCLCKTSDRIFLKKIAIHKSFTPGLLVRGNAENLSLAFSNIVVNALEAVKESEGKIWITAYQVKDKVKVVFKDNGSGMEPEVADHMFEKNFSGKLRGLGVGLTHAKEILDRHNASVSVNSEPGTGTTILIEFKKL